MNRRDFVGRVALGAAAACTLGSAASANGAGRLRLRFIGMMGFVEREDHSFLVATPGQHATHHMVHVPFLMARAGTPVARALGMTAAPGVVPAAFDTQLDGTQPSAFVYRNLENSAIEIVGGRQDAVVNRASQMAHLADIAPGKRVRGNLERWAAATVSLRGGHIENSSGHPDAGKTWRFGTYAQQLTDAVNYTSADGPATIRLTSGKEVRTFDAAASGAELWMISAAVPESRDGNPTRLIHSELLFDYLVDAPAVLAECEQATGRMVPPTDLPFRKPTTASTGLVAGSAVPPLTEFCFIADILLGGGSK